MIGIGGEGIVVEKELEIQIMQGTVMDYFSKKAENIQLKSKERIITAMKFVKFEPDLNENFKGKGFKRGSKISLIRLSSENWTYMRNV